MTMLPAATPEPLGEIDAKGQRPAMPFPCNCGSFKPHWKEVLHQALDELRLA